MSPYYRVQFVQSRREFTTKFPFWRSLKLYSGLLNVTCYIRPHKINHVSTPSLILIRPFDVPLSEIESNKAQNNAIPFVAKNFEDCLIDEPVYKKADS